MIRPSLSRAERRLRLLEVGQVFFKLGVTGFGGPAAHIALMEREVVGRRAWLSAEEFLDLVGAANLIPGPNSTELAIHIGHRRAGAAGLLLAGACFIVPAAAITLAFAWAYVRFGSVPTAAALLYGMKPALLAVVLGVVARLGRAVARDRFALVLALVVAAASLGGLDELMLILVCGLAGVFRSSAANATAARGFALLALPSGLVTGAGGAATAPGLGALALFFLKVGSVLYGSGYVLIAFLRGGLVVDRHWLTERQLLDAVAIGQFTPGPVFTTATFVGYLLHGSTGALLATLAIFLPSFVFVALTAPWVPKMRASPAFGGFLDGVNAASLGLLTAVVALLAHDAIAGWPAMLIGALALATVAVGRVNPSWVILGGAALGFLSSLFGLAP